MDLTEEKSDLANNKNCHSALPDIPINTMLLNTVFFIWYLVQEYICYG